MSRLRSRMLMMEPAESFSPTSITGLLRWFDFSDASTLFTDTGRTTPVASDGDTIAGITDKSGTGGHGSQAAGPTYKTAIQNGKSVARFNGTSQYFTSAALSGSGITIVLVCKATYSAGGVPVILDNCAGVNAPTGMIVAVEDRGGGNGTKTIRTFVNGGGASRTIGKDNSYGATAWKIIESAFTGPSSDYYALNGVDQTPYDNVAAGTGTFDPGTGLLAVGALNNGTTFCGLDLAEMLIYNTKLSAGNLTSLRTYANSKWAIY